MSALFRRIGFAFKCLFLVLFTGKLPEPLPAEFLRGHDRDRQSPTAAGEVGVGGRVPAGPAAPPPVAPTADRAVQVLALLQRDGRLIDFLYEDIAGYPDDQVGAAVREVHASCRDVLRRYLSLEPVLAGDEGTPTVVPDGFDPATIKLVGSVSGQAPFRGVLRHHGWRATRVELPAFVEGGGRSVIAPAEVEIA